MTKIRMGCKLDFGKKSLSGHRCYRKSCRKTSAFVSKGRKSFNRGITVTIEDTLKRSDVFLGLDNRELTIIASLPSSRSISFETGQFLFKTGEEAKSIFVVEEGRINVIAEVPKSSENKSTVITIDVLSKGSLLGWSALVRPHNYVLSAFCQKPSKLVIIDGNELLSLFDENCTIGYKVLQALSQVIGVRFRDLQQLMITGKRWPFVDQHSYT
jgi:CRP/FNR family cyclic AMP-dependent transcriptional regulator